MSKNREYVKNKSNEKKQAEAHRSEWRLANVSCTDRECIKSKIVKIHLKLAGAENRIIENRRAIAKNLEYLGLFPHCPIREDIEEENEKLRSMIDFCQKAIADSHKEMEGLRL